MYRSQWWQILENYPTHVTLSFCVHSTVFNFSWIEDDYIFEYFVGVCVRPVSTALDNCYVVQSITSPNGDVSLHCLGGNVDVQVTDTKGTCI